MPASPTLPTRTATPGRCKNAVTVRRDLAHQNERSTIMGLSWQQGPLSGVSVVSFLTPEPLPKRLTFAEPLRRRLRVKLADEWIADSEDVLVLHEPGHTQPLFRRYRVVHRNRRRQACQPGRMAVHRPARLR